MKDTQRLEQIPQAPESPTFRYRPSKYVRLDCPGELIAATEKLAKELCGNTIEQLTDSINEMAPYQST